MDVRVALAIVATVVLGATLCALALLTMRGRFGTPRRRVVFDLTELAASHHHVRRAHMSQSARCMGHSADDTPVRGAGMLWLTDDTLGFTVREPRRDFTIDLADVVKVEAEELVRRPGVRPIRSSRPFVVVEWTTTEGTEAMVSWRLDPEVGGADEAEWVEAIERAAVVREIRSVNA